MDEEEGDELIELKIMIGKDDKKFPTQEYKRIQRILDEVREFLFSLYMQR